MIRNHFGGVEHQSLVKILPHVLQDISQAVSRNIHATSKGIQNGDTDDVYSFGRDYQYAFYQSPFQAEQWLTAEVLFVDIDYCILVVTIFHNIVVKTNSH